MSKYYACVEDRQGGGFGMGRCYTADEWLQQAREWCEADDNTDMDNYLENIHKNRKAWTDEEIVDLVSEVWDIGIQPADKALAILKADGEKWGNSGDELETIEEIEKVLNNR